MRCKIIRIVQSFILLLLGVSKCRSQLCKFWTGRSIKFHEPSTLEIAVTFSEECATKPVNFWKWSFVVSHRPVIEEHPFRLQCDCRTRNCSKKFTDINIQYNIGYEFTFLPKCFRTACDNCTPFLCIFSLRSNNKSLEPVEIKQAPVDESTTQLPIGSRDTTTLPIFIGCLGLIALVTVLTTLAFLYRYHRRHSQQAYDQVHVPDSHNSRTSSSITEPYESRTTQHVLVVANPSKKCSKFLEVLSLFSDQFNANDVLKCLNELTLNFYDWADNIPTTYDSLVVVLDTNICSDVHTMDSFRIRDLMQCFKNSLGPDKDVKIKTYVVCFGYDEKLCNVAAAHYPYLKTGALFCLPDIDVLRMSDISENSPLVELLLYLCRSFDDTSNSAREHIRNILKSTLINQIDSETV